MEVQKTLGSAKQQHLPTLLPIAALYSNRPRWRKKTRHTTPPSCLAQAVVGFTRVHTTPRPSNHADMRVTALATVLAEIHLESASFLEPQLVKQPFGGSLGHCVQIYANLFSIRGLNHTLYERRRRSFLPARLGSSNIHQHCRIFVSLCQQSQPNIVTNNSVFVHAARHCGAS
jgi:hypothetical protein